MDRRYEFNNVIDNNEVKMELNIVIVANRVNGCNFKRVKFESVFFFFSSRKFISTKAQAPRKDSNNSQTLMDIRSLSHSITMITNYN